MRTIDTVKIEEALATMCLEAVCEIPSDVVGCYRHALKNETSEEGRDVLTQIMDNSEIASRDMIPSCQDTGMAVVFLEVGMGVRLTGKPVGDAVNHGISRGYTEGALRKSVVGHPLERINTGDNTPAVIHYEITEGDGIKISFMPKGFGSENMSALAMLKPSDGREGVVDFILRTVEEAGPNPCPPLFIGVGLGGTAEKAMLLSKKALLRKSGTRSPNEIDASLELELIEKINWLGIGPAGLGGNTTVFDVFVESFPTHIAGLPVAVNICCHALRHKEVQL